MATYETAPDQYVTVSGIKFAYRHLGPKNGVPLVLLMGFRGTMDHWDPAFVNPIAAKRPVIIIENAGVGRSEGEVPRTFPEWTQHYIDILKAQGITKADVLGYSMGGCIAQLVALNAPGLVRKLILCGTIPSDGEGVTRAPVGPFNQIKAATTQEEHRKAFLSCFFTTSESSQAAGAAAWERMVNARSNRADHVDPKNAHRQAVAFVRFMDRKQATDGSYDRFNQLTMPVLIANGAWPSDGWDVADEGRELTVREYLGNDDLLLPTDNSILMWKMLSKANAQLHLYPNAGHGFLWQYADQFSKLINDFLDREEDSAKTLSRL